MIYEENDKTQEQITERNEITEEWGDDNKISGGIEIHP